MVDLTITQQLKKPFPLKDISWRVGSTTADKSKGMALAYLDSRAVMKRLDDVCGDLWQAEYPFDGCCRIGIMINPTTLANEQWVWRSNGAGETQVEGEKGKFSDAFKRAAVLWGIGRYLYQLDNIWVPIKPQGKSHVIAETPKMPSWATPEGYEALLAKGSK